MKELLAPVQAWWRSVTPREQKMVMGMGALTVLAIAYWGIWQPLSERTAQAQARLQPRGEMMQVWIQPLPFSQLVSWIAYLQERQGVSVDAIDIDRGKVNGVVEVKRLQLKRGG